MSQKVEVGAIYQNMRTDMRPRCKVLSIIDKCVEYQPFSANGDKIPFSVIVKQSEFEIEWEKCL